MRNLFLLAILLTNISIAFAQAPAYDKGQKLKDVMNLINTYYTDSVDNEKLADAAIVKILEELDPHSTYTMAKDVKRSEEPLQANFEGIGITFQILKDTVMVLEVVPSGPSEKVGLKAGDKIVMVNDTIFAGNNISNNDVVGKLRGPKGTKVKVSIKRNGSSELIDFVITRDKIPIFSIEASYMAAPGVGYIKLIRFAASTMQEFFQALDKLRNQGMQDLIIDLQGNTGGYLYTAVDLCNQFLDAKEMIVYTEGLHSAKQPYFSDGRGQFKTGKVVVMIDEGSASASEILSGCIQDNDRGLVVGRRTWGKGLVQKPFNLPDGSQIKLTTAQYYIPSGRCIQRPYDKGKAEYQREYSRRVESGEVFGRDTFHFPDSLLYYTKNKRKVYGGGGVMPDFFVPLDTSNVSRYYSAIVRRGILNNFILELTDRKRNELSATFSNADSFVRNYKVCDAIFKELTDKAESDTAFLKDITGINSLDSISPQMIDSVRTAHISKSGESLKNDFKSLLARNLFDSTAFWRVKNEVNPVFKKTVDVITHPEFFVLLQPEDDDKGKKKKKK